MRWGDVCSVGSSAHFFKHRHKYTHAESKAWSWDDRADAVFRWTELQFLSIGHAHVYRLTDLWRNNHSDSLHNLSQLLLFLPVLSHTCRISLCFSFPSSAFFYYLNRIICLIPLGHLMKADLRSWPCGEPPAWHLLNTNCHASSDTGNQRIWPPLGSWLLK